MLALGLLRFLWLGYTKFLVQPIIFFLSLKYKIGYCLQYSIVNELKGIFICLSTLQVITLLFWIFLVWITNKKKDYEWTQVWILIKTWQFLCLSLTLRHHVRFLDSTCRCLNWSHQDSRLATLCQTLLYSTFSTILSCYPITMHS